MTKSRSLPRRGLWRYSLALLAGVALGLCAGAGLVGWHWNRNFADWYLSGVGDQANVAKEIYAGRGPELANRIRDAMPEYAAAVEHEFSGAAGRDWALWQIHDVYEAADSTPPPEVQALFMNLPPRPSCKAPSGSSNDHADEVHQIIDRYNAQVERWYADGDVDAVVSVFAEDAWQMPPNQPPLVGREAIREYWHRAVAWGDWEFNLEAQEVALSGPIAVERGKYVLEFTAGPGAPPGMASFEDRGSYLAHWRLEADGRWRIVGDAPVSELPAPCPQAAQEGPD